MEFGICFRDMDLLESEVNKYGWLVISYVKNKWQRSGSTPIPSKTQSRNKSAREKCANNSYHFSSKSTVKKSRIWGR